MLDDQLGGIDRVSRQAWETHTAFVQLPFSAEPLCRYLAEEKRLLLLPGHVYGTAYEPFLHMGFGCSTEQFEEGLTELLQELQGWRGDELPTHV